jgi:polyisoprenoid-binding protein YceI
MKTTIRSLALFLGMAVFFSACKKDKDNGPKGSFTHDGKTTTTNNATHIGFKNRSGQVSYSDIFLSSVAYTSTYSGKMSAVEILFDNDRITAGTYTFKRDSDPNYDPTKNFFDANTYIDVTFPATTGGTKLEDITGGTATVTVNGSNFTIDFNLDFNGKKVTGSYTGPYTSIIEEY